MINRKNLLESPNYLLTTYQLEIYRHISNYMKENNLTQKDLAKQLNVSDAYVSQILNGNFNFTLKKLIELGLKIGKVPTLEFVDKDKFWLDQDKSTLNVLQANQPVIFFGSPHINYTIKRDEGVEKFSKVFSAHSKEPITI